MTLWHCDTVTLWHCDTVTLWHCDTVTLWHCDTVTLWHCDTVTVCDTCHWHLSLTLCQWQCLHVNGNVVYDYMHDSSGQQTATNCHFRRSTYEHNSQVTEHHIIHDNITYYRPPIITYYSNLRRYNSTYKSQRISRRLIPNINHVSITVHVSLYLLLLAAVHCRVCVILL